MGAERLKSTLAEKYFKPKMISETALPGALDVELEPS
jgi:hypothetical protein